MKSLEDRICLFVNVHIVLDIWKMFIYYLLNIWKECVFILYFIACFFNETFILYFVIIFNFLYHLLYLSSYYLII